MENIEQHLASYLKLGFSPIPLRGKVANYHWKDYQFHLRDFTKPNANVGIRAGLLPSGDYLWFVDLDRKELLGSFYESHPTLTDAPLVSTGKGWHIYLTWKKQPRTCHLTGMDIIANGYVVAAPSIHPNGHVYKFIVPLKGLPPTYNPEWLSENFFPFPKSFSNHTCIAAHDQEISTIGKHVLAGVPQGQRHNFLISYLGAMHNARLTEEEATERALDWGSRCKPPLTKEEVVKAVHTAWERWDIYESVKIKGKEK